MKKSFKKSLLLTAVGLLPSYSAWSKINLDAETDAIPVVSVSVVLPVGFQAYKQEESGLFNLLSETFDQGSQNDSRKDFYKKLAAFGAGTGFSVRNEFSIWSMDFPFVAGKDYAPLFKVLADQFQNPRFNAETFKLAKLKLSSSIQAALDSDATLVRTTAARLRAFKDFDSYPVLLDTLEKITLEQVVSAYRKEYLKEMDAWAGMVGPKEAIEVVKKGLETIFPNLGYIQQGVMKRPLPAPARKEFKLKQYSAAIIIDRNDRTQTQTSYSWMKAGVPENFKKALAHSFGHYVLADSGLYSYFGDEIRNKRGLAYAVGGIDDNYLGNTIIGLDANPQRKMNSVSTDVIGELVKNAWDEGTVFSIMPADEWATRFRAFQYDWILSERTADGRLGRRLSLVTGDADVEMALSDPRDWKIGQKDVSEYFKSRYSGSSRLLLMVGDAKELTPIIEKAFPNYKILVVPYKELTKSETFKNLASKL